MNKRLGPQEWIGQALRTLAADGVEAVRIERLATALHVTKGSFYWHFADRGALLAATLEAWKARATADVIAQVEAGGGAPRDRMKTLLGIVFGADGRLELQIRAWAANDDLALTAQHEIDGLRTGYVRSLFLELGFDPPEASARAQFAYLALIGQYALGPSAQGRLSKPDQFDRVFKMLVARR
jgi:AcrR family transcriptional regulator